MKQLKIIKIIALLNIITASFAAAQNVEEVAVKDRIYPTPKDVKFEVSKKDFSANEIMLLQSLEAKRIEIERKAQVLLVREKLIDLSEEKLQEKIKKLEMLEGSIKELLKEVSTKEEKRLQDLSVVYSEMKPALAAERLNILDEITVYGVLKRMNFKKAAKILEKMNIEKVKVISKMLAEKTLLPEVKQN
jgi:flagellar motility protein MotE (MotC chaperone)